MIDNGNVVCMALLDLSAAFDTVSHNLLFNRLRFGSGFGGKVLSWLQSYLTNRTQQVVIVDKYGSGSLSDKNLYASRSPTGFHPGTNSLYSVYLAHWKFVQITWSSLSFISR